MADTSLETFAARIVNTTKQIRFAGVLALTRVAFEAQKAVKESLAGKFTLRNKHTQRGIRFTQATKETEESEVFGLDKYIAEHEEGGKRGIPPGPGEFRIPAFLHEVAGTTEDKRIKKSIRASTILKKIDAKGRLPKIGVARPFVATMRSGATGIFVRKRDVKAAKGRPRDDRLPIRLLYKFQRKKITLDPRGWFQGTVEKTYDEKFERIYAKAVTDAIRSAK